MATRRWLIFWKKNTLKVCFISGQFFLKNTVSEVSLRKIIDKLQWFFFPHPHDRQWQHPFHIQAGNVSVWGNICLILWAVTTLLIQIWFLSFQGKWSPQANTLCCRSYKWINTAFPYRISASSQLSQLIHSFIGVLLVIAHSLVCISTCIFLLSYCLLIFTWFLDILF